MNVCLIKAAGFAPQGNFKGGSQLGKRAENENGWNSHKMLGMGHWQHIWTFHRSKLLGLASRRHWGGRHSSVKELEIKMAEIHTKCWEWVTNNGFERLPDQNCWIWLPGVTKGGVQLTQLGEELEIIQDEIHANCWESVTDNRFVRLSVQNCWIWLPDAVYGG